MADLMTEAEQIELLKRLWKEYAVPAIVGIVIAMVIIFGWRFYQQYKTRMDQGGSLVFAHLMVSDLNNSPKEALQQATILQKQFKHTPYASLAALYVAKEMVVNHDYQSAQQQLQWVIDHGVSDTYQQIARIRLARLCLAQNQPKVALEKLKSVDDHAFDAMINMVRGDAYQQLKQYDNAREAYQESLSHLSQEASLQPLIEMKLQALPSTNNKG